MKLDHWKLFFLLFSLLLIISVHGRIAEKTQYDGVTSTSYQNTYLKFTGTSGIELTEEGLQDMKNYTMTLWFKLQQYPSDHPNQLISAKPYAFECLLNLQTQLQCLGDSGAGGGELLVNSNVHLSNWYIMVLKSGKNGTNSAVSQLKIIELSGKEFSSMEQKLFFPANAVSISFSTMTIGIDEDRESNGFIGNLRNLRFYEAYLNDETLYRTQFTYLYPNRFMKLQLPLNTLGDYRNQAGLAIGSSIGSPLEQDSDSLGVTQCSFYDSNQYQPYLKPFANFTSNQKMKQYYLASPFNPATDQDESLQIWFYHRKQTLAPAKDEVLFYHSNTIRVQFNSSDQTTLLVDNFIMTNMTCKFKVPYNRWVFLQVQSSKRLFNATLYDMDGTLLSFQAFDIPSGKLPSQISRYVTVLDGFNGLIHGIKYYRAAVPPVKPDFHYFTDESEVDVSTSQFYFFITQSNQATNSSYKNLGLQKAPLQFESGNISYGNTYFRENYTFPINNTQGTFDEPMKFDGYACMDNKSKLYFTTNDYIQSNILVTNPIRQYTVEYWVKAENGLSEGKESYMMSLTDSPKSSKQQMSIQMEEDGGFVCYPAIQTNSSLKLRYFDFSKDSRSWTHISCIFDPNLISGYLFQDTVNYQYFLSTPPTTASTHKLSQQTYLLYLNANSKTLSGGVQSAFYSEIRFWSTARTLSEIQTLRYQQINLQATQGLLAYIKLNSEVVTISQQVDLEYITKTSVIKSGNAEWVNEKELQICPVGTYAPSLQDFFCYRDNLQGVQLIVYKKGNGTYIVSSYFSSFLNSKQREAASDYFDNRWTLVDQNTSTTLQEVVSQQSEKQILELKSSEVSNIKSTTVQLEMQDKLKFQDKQSSKIQLLPLDCANIYDKQTQQAFVIKDIEGQKGIDDVVIQYEYTDCGSDYKMDPSLMTFQVDGRTAELPQADHNVTAKKFTLKSLYHSSLPLNDYFYLRIKATWRPLKSSDPVVSYHLLYKLRFPSKLRVILLPSTLLLFKNQSLQVNSLIDFINTPVTTTNFRTYSTEWLCPQPSVCANSRSQLRLNYDEVKSAGGFQFWVNQTIGMRANTEYIQSDGSTQSNQSIQIVWLDMSNNVSIKTINQVNKNIPFTWEISENIPRLELFSIQWETSPVVAGECLLNYANRSQYSINQTCLKENQIFEVRLKVLYLPNSLLVANQKQNFTTPRSPYGGKLACNITQGYAFKDIINCTASGWQAWQQSSLRYQFYIRDEEQEGNLEVMQTSSNKTEFISKVPPTKDIVVIVEDQYGSKTLASLVVNFTIEPPPPTPPTPPPSTPPGTPPSNSTTNSTTPPPSPPPPPLTLDELTVSSKQLRYLSNSSSNSSSNLTELRNQVTLITDSLALQTSQLSNASVLNDTNQVKTIVIVTAQVLNDIVSSASLILNQSQMYDVQKTLSTVVNNMDQVKKDPDFQRNFLQINANSLRYLENTRNASSNQQEQKQKNTTSMVRENMLQFEAKLAAALLEGESVTQNTSSFNFTVFKVSQQQQSGPLSFKSNDVNFSFPLASAKSPTVRQSLTAINYKVSPFIGSKFPNQTLITNNTVFFAYRDNEGHYLNSSYILDRITLQFSLPNLSTAASTSAGSVTCAYFQPLESPTYWGTEACQTELNLETNQVTCRCQHMSYYTVIDNNLNVTAYEEEQRRQHEGVKEIRVRNWVFVVPVAYLVMVGIIGVIYSNVRDQGDFRFITDHGQEGGEAKEGSGVVIQLNPVIFQKKMAFQSYGKTLQFCSYYLVFLLLLHPLLSLKHRFDPTLPRFYKFLFLYTRLVLIFGLCFYFLRDFQNFEQIITQEKESMTYDLVFIGVACIICALITVPMPIGLYGCIRSRYYLMKQVVEGDEKMVYSAGVDRKKQIIQNQKENNVTKFQIDPTLPMKLLFLLNASSHDKLQQQHPSFSSGSSSRAVGTKLTELEREQKDWNRNQQKQQAQLREELSQYDRTPTKQKEYIVDNFTDMDLMRGNQQSNRRKNAQESAERKHDYSERSMVRQPNNNMSIMIRVESDVTQIQDFGKSGSGVTAHSNKRTNSQDLQPYMTFQNESRHHSRKVGTQLPPITSLKEIRLNFDKDEEEPHQRNHKYKSLTKHGGSGHHERKQSKLERSFRSSNRVSQTEENDHYYDEERKHGTQFEGGSSDDSGPRLPPKRNTQQQQQQRHLHFMQPEQADSSTFSHQNFPLPNGAALDLDSYHQESGISLDSNMIAAEDKKELIERVTWCCFVSRILFVLGCLTVQVLIYGVVGYRYWEDNFQNRPNEYVWVAVFFGAQIVGMVIVNPILILIMTWIATACCCKKKKVCLAKSMRECLYIYEDYKYVNQFSRNGVA